ncbi:MAG: hypothetical protein AB9846_10010 [Tenuifilaceae bacterium]
MMAQNQSLSEKQIAIIANLITKNDDQVISLLQDFREHGELFIVPPLIDMLFTKRSQKLKESIIEFIIDIKNQDVVSIIIQSIRNHINEDGITGLVSICWQSSLDFSQDLPLFVEILCDGDYHTSFEASTVIENSIGLIDQSQRDSHVKYIKLKLKNASTEKHLLLTEMIDVIEKFGSED